MQWVKSRQVCISTILHAKILKSLNALAVRKDQVTVHLLKLWKEANHIRAMIDYRGCDATKRFINEGTTQPKNRKPMNLGMHYNFGFDI